MSWITKRWPKILVLIIGIILVSTKLTDADLLDIEMIRDHLFRATTLDFSNRQTVNEFPTSTLFNVSGLISNGFAVESLRVKKEGEMEFDYQITANKTAGDDVLCNSLQLRVFDEWRQVFFGYLNEFALNASVTEVGYDDLVFVLSTDGSGQGNLMCSFNFILRTTVDGTPNVTAFWDEEVIQNQVTSGL